MSSVCAICCATELIANAKLPMARYDHGASRWHDSRSQARSGSEDRPSILEQAGEELDTRGRGGPPRVELGYELAASSGVTIQVLGIGPGGVRDAFGNGIKITGMVWL